MKPLSLSVWLFTAGEAAWMHLYCWLQLIIRDMRLRLVDMSQNFLKESYLHQALSTSNHKVLANYRQLTAKVATILLQKCTFTKVPMVRQSFFDSIIIIVSECDPVSFVRSHRRPSGIVHKPSTDQKWFNRPTAQTNTSINLSHLWGIFLLMFLPKFKSSRIVIDTDLLSLFTLVWSGWWGYCNFMSLDNMWIFSCHKPHLLWLAMA